MISLVNIILEAEKPKYSYGCVMLYFHFPEIGKMQKDIDKEDVYNGEDGDPRTYGLEKEHHTTLLYGLHDDVMLDQVKSVLDKYTYSPLKLCNVSIFDNPKYDVLKFDVGYSEKGGAYLSKINKELSELPHTTEYPDYHPHSTIGYLKKGTGQKYVSMFKGKEYVITPDYAVYSVPDGNKHKIKINVK